jgi:hypothetical protein
MKIGKHAIRRYKKRIGKRTATRERIEKDIKKHIETSTIKKVYYKETGQYRIWTPKFIAVCEKGMVVTILPPNENCG